MVSIVCVNALSTQRRVLWQMEKAVWENAFSLNRISQTTYILQ